ncbi:16S rRNA pseudouridine(516) synthase [Simiduia curdlanivorans]|uniref:Pseudouridine synthase n=1 Tax=Simiduia curdlanivorans TaxID=1492769 RepID=A0ABV8V5Y5_9GAMM|nr:16S rRNA pseudouridine(516) synthase [Simiduia curdlanivorans]MDN3640884.1 16S rRNA pseudouridine(516) synthase [Simiduia curdlanivorans]
MRSKRDRLDRHLKKVLSISRVETQQLLAKGEIFLDGQRATDIQQLVGEFTQVVVAGRVLQNKLPRYIQLHKPQGVVSATRDDKHQTVIDLIAADFAEQLHLVGRLDFNSTGLVLLTTDGRWSRRLTEPAAGVEKHYRVTLDKPITPEIVEAFERGLYFSFENIITRPVRTAFTDPLCVDIFLHEGRYHQIKRMFGHFQITVLSLHRLAIGNVVLDSELAEGEWRELSQDEVFRSVI